MRKTFFYSLFVDFFLDYRLREWVGLGKTVLKKSDREKGSKFVSYHPVSIHTCCSTKKMENREKNKQNMDNLALQHSISSFV